MVSPVVAFHEVETHFPPSGTSCLSAVGRQKVDAKPAAKKKVEEAKEYSLLSSYLSSRADVPPESRARSQYDGH